MADPSGLVLHSSNSQPRRLNQALISSSGISTIGLNRQGSKMGMGWPGTRSCTQVGTAQEYEE